MKYYPVFLNLTGKQVLVVGAGAVALRKVRRLLAAGARVDVVAPEAISGFAGLSRMRILRRGFRLSDLAGRFLVIAATQDAVLNGRIFRASERRGILVNCVDDPAHCNLILPSIVERNGFTVAISTGGKSPLAAKILRKQMEGLLTKDRRLVRRLSRMRQQVSSLSAQKKRRYWRKVEKNLWN